MVKFFESEGNYSLTEYKECQKKNWESSKRIVLYENDERLGEFINNAVAKKNLGQKIYFGIVPDSLAKLVMDEWGIDIFNRNVSLAATEVRKILKDHGDEESEKKRGQRAIVPSDFALIRGVIESPDAIEIDDELYNGRPVLRFKKNIDGRVTVVTYDSSKHKDLAVQTMYAGNKKSLSTPTAEQASVNTSETESGTASNRSIAPLEHTSKKSVYENMA